MVEVLEVSLSGAHEGWKKAKDDFGRWVLKTSSYQKSVLS